MSVFLVLLTYVSAKLLRPPRGKRSRRSLGGYKDTFFVYLAAIAQKHTPVPHGTVRPAFHGLLWLWLVSCFFAMNFFTASLLADMLIKVEEPRIRTVADVLKNPDKRILLFGAAGFTELVLYVDLPAYRAVYQQVLRTGGELHPSEMYTEDNLQDVLNKKTVIMQEEKGTLEDQVRRNCHKYRGKGFFYFSEESLGQLVMAWVARKDIDPIIHREMNNRLRWLLDTGMVDLFMRDVSPGPDECWLRLRDKSDMDRRQLHFEDLRAMFMLYVALLLTAVVAFVLECLVAAWAKGNR
ncbi:uncharacterized protein LOC144173299 [Haemaphysalis longicornis]